MQQIFLSLLHLLTRSKETKETASKNSTLGLNMQEILRKKKEGQVLSQEEIQFWVNGVTDKSIPEYQSTALMMAIFFQGMNIIERSQLTRAMSKSGKYMDYSKHGAPIVDKHSTGGIGDKTSLIIAPILTALGLKVPMVSGRGLGHTGGTIDKLEGIPGFDCSLSFNEMEKSIDEFGGFICGQTSDIAPADKVLYSLRDVTQTVNEISLITSSILSKKFAEGLSVLTLDVKYGSGAFMVDVKDSINLGKSLVETAVAGGIKCEGVITRMEYPIGEWSGNSCEVYESILAMTPGSDYCKIIEQNLSFSETSPCFVKIGSDNFPQSPKEILVYLTFGLLMNTVMLSGQTPKEAFEKIKEVWIQGKALDQFHRMIKNQKGNFQKFEKQSQIILQNLNNAQSNPNVFEFKAKKQVKISKVYGQKLGYVLVELGAGRKVKTDKIDPLISMKWLASPSQVLNEGDVICQIFHPNAKKLASVDLEKSLNEAVEFTENLSFQDQNPFIHSVLQTPSNE